ncbi:hypothetical protein Q9R46_14425 [Paenibacillus sp. RRE4]|uniref:hypothetical protein n=1 Tax=Paenibacillus sp. RRE4 TaxID=2962587 RepID=UPI0028825940|nr:hypothetical protein [Paenibacillus sp. RRE4]MDT0123853.1 hypothetical protein [Paenibacillus sp. RRE4]
MNKGMLLLISLLSAIAIQLLSLGFFESSVVGNIPILGNMLLAIDIGYLIYYMQGDITITVLQLILPRAISIASTAYTLSELFRLSVFELKDSLGYKIFIFCMGVMLNFIFLWLFSSIILTLFETIIKGMNKMDEMLQMLNGLSF